MTSTNCDRATFERLIRPLLRDLHLRARGLCPSSADAQDLVQDTLERALRKFGRFQPGSDVRAWLFTILSHLFIDRWRRDRRAPIDPLPAHELEQVAAPDPASPGAWEVVDDAHVRTALATVQQPFREVLELRLRQRCSYREISQRLRIPVATVGTRIQRGRSHLRQALEQLAPAA
jgi:RNA polymerase sigma-70 factor (ECF subfamily)